MIFMLNSRELNLFKAGGARSIRCNGWWFRCGAERLYEVSGWYLSVLALGVLTDIFGYVWLIAVSRVFYTFGVRGLEEKTLRTVYD